MDATEFSFGAVQEHCISTVAWQVRGDLLFGKHCELRNILWVYLRERFSDVWVLHLNVLPIMLSSRA